MRDLAAEGRTMVVVTHELQSIFAIADNAVFLDGEKRVQTALGKPTQLRENPPNAKVGHFLNREAVEASQE